jgi:hypothetical protein
VPKSRHAARCAPRGRGGRAAPLRAAGGDGSGVPPPGPPPYLTFTVSCMNGWSVQTIR